ncbi:phosphotyrosine protein [Wolfiporia cocos MD-104 SS10]|uniref:Phosphotyrosine protein n=1 Tax=Wolfiporia cocos (strain MD-104) TaxID=742152 RepID=A0A2H3JPM4_WOLCO|nr:phosphotyrosine protein [Wolfiporia cocos MD-104 SS10]
MATTAVEMPINSASHTADPEHMHTPLSDRAASHSHEPSVEEKLLKIAQLVVLASQHHGSEYNRIKFGPRGSPVHYVPFSIQVPERVKALQEHQARYALRKAWWPCNRNNAIHGSPMIDVLTESTHPPLSHPASLTDLPREISAAMSAPLISPSVCATGGMALSQMQIKTSDSHPINVSIIIPEEVLHIIASHLIRREDLGRSPVFFGLASPYFLDHITAYLPNLPPELVSRAYTSPAPPFAPTMSARPITTYCPPIHTLPRPTRLAYYLKTNPTLRRAIHSAETIHAKRNNLNNIVPPHLYFEGSIYESESSPNTLSRHATLNEQSDSPSPRRSMSAPAVATIALTEFSETGVAQTALQSPNQSNQHSETSVASSTENSATELNLTASMRPTASVALGNLFLSSCPGKKVRLDGPVKGRCGVCRDLRKDLQRIRGMDVACIVCCLDDEELELLGVTWEDYSRIADEIGIDILRIPIPEGLTPASLRTFDIQLVQLINTYTLRGQHILAHCRGGVGRAGLIASCWILRLGLCGWVDSVPTLPDATMEQQDAPLSRRDTTMLVKRVINIVRRRRSPKAIETYEQVRFLVDFVELLRARASCPVPPGLPVEAEAQVD